MDIQVSSSQRFVLGLQHALAMFGATVLVPILTGLHPSVALATAGIGTLVFHFITQGKVPVFLGSSFAFIAVIQVVGKNQGLEYATGGLMVAGLVYLAMAGLIQVFGVERVRSFIPPVVAGPMIMVIGLTLSPIAVGMASSHWLVAIITLLAVVFTAVFARGFLKMLPIIIGVAVGMAAAGVFGVLDISPITGATFFALPPFFLPKFSLSAISLIAPVAIVTMVEHVGDIRTNSAVIGKDLLKSPGLHRTMMGDGIATMLAGLLGGPANTTYSENTGVLAVTKVYDPSILRIAAVVAIVLSLFGHLGAILQTIPQAAMGGISIVLFGMICSVGIRTVVDARVDFTSSRNLVVSAVILVLGIGGATVKLAENLEIGGLALAAIVGIVLNKILPETEGLEDAAKKAGD